MTLQGSSDGFDPVELEELMADLRALVDMRLVDEIRIPGRPSRYAVSHEKVPAMAVDARDAVACPPEP